MCSQPKGGKDVDSERELILENARSISEGLGRMARLAQEAADSLDARIEYEDLDGMVEAVEVREALERPQTLSIEVSEEVFAAVLERIERLRCAYVRRANPVVA
jgi:hypothetical protein